MARKKRILQSKHPYHVVTRTNNREFRFDKRKVDKELLIIVAEILMTASKKYAVNLFHFVLMSNHFHLSVETPKENLPRFMQWVNARIAERFNKAQGRTGHFWGGRYWATIITGMVRIGRTVRYIYNNGPAAGLCKSAIDHEESSIHYYVTGRWVYLKVTPDGWFISMGLTDEERRKNFEKYVVHMKMTDEELAEVRAGMRNRIYGREEDVRSILEEHDPDDLERWERQLERQGSAARC